MSDLYIASQLPPIHLPHPLPCMVSIRNFRNVCMCVRVFIYTSIPKTIRTSCVWGRARSRQVLPALSPFSFPSDRDLHDVPAVDAQHPGLPRESPMHCFREKGGRDASTPGILRPTGCVRPKGFTGPEARVGFSDEKDHSSFFTAF